jgi:GNAT superfamily N-acetyltransferase
MPGSAEPGADPAAGRIGWWRCAGLRPDGSLAFLAAVASSRHPDAAVVELAHDVALAEAGEDTMCTAHFDGDGRVHRLVVAARAAPKAPPLWFTEIRESASRPPAVHLMAFTGSGVAAGTLLDEHDVRGVGVTTEDQLGAVRWWPGTGEVDQIYVTPQWRRHSIARALIIAAGTLGTARGWPRLWGDGQRTELGERWVATSQWRERAAPLTHIAPPMTPGDPGTRPPGAVPD